LKLKKALISKPVTNLSFDICGGIKKQSVRKYYEKQNISSLVGLNFSLIMNK
jgi:hypothetical protein